MFGKKLLEKFVSELGPLVNPENETHKIDISGISAKDLLKMLELMLIIRYTEEAIGDLIKSGYAKCPCHLGIGQEAVAVGISHHLTGEDKIFSGHRSHPHFLALGTEVDLLLCEVLGKENGSSHGMGGSQHLVALDKGFVGSVPIVAGTIPLAVGAALATKFDGKGNIAVAYFGDGASEEGGLHESLNFASKMSLPVLFVCENNLFASHLDISYRQPSDRISRFADAHKVPSIVVDGNDVAAVSKAAGQFISNCRQGKGPGFIEAITYRWKGHVGYEENIDVGLRRKEKDLIAWKKRDPIMRLKEALIADGKLTAQEYQSIQGKQKMKVDKAVVKAKESNYPEDSALLDMVYVNRNKNDGK
ncbi:MAG: thiamine pyrophosphate-dependent dehydrogenase E1 component subunit alpha [Nitrospinota bacterium]|nr:thiamine pyrophosphate-dependent dehydrogenase E1 component subunit alpha [Nitrospinota bacterium]